MQTRREFIGKGLKLTSSLALASIGANALFANDKTIYKEGEPIQSKGYAAFSKEFKFKEFSFTRHPLGANDVLIEIMYAGICHSDLHAVLSDHGQAVYPMVPGHEIMGRVVALGKNAKKFKIGDWAGVGCMVNSCGECEACKQSKEQYCMNSKTVFTYNSKDVFHGGANTYGGYSNNIVLNEKFAMKISKDAEAQKVAPLLCAGITTYSPIKFSKVSKDQNVAVAGLGGLGHMALQYMVKLGANVTCFDILDKKEAALALGAREFVNVKSARFKEFKNSFDFIISTIPYHYDLNAYHKMLKFGGELAIVGLPAPKQNPSINSGDLIWQFQNKRIYSSLIGGLKETQEMLDFSIKNKIYPQVELIRIQDLDKAYERVAKGEANFRIVIDMKSLV